MPVIKVENSKSGVLSVAEDGEYAVFSYKGAEPGAELYLFGEGKRLLLGVTAGGSCPLKRRRERGWSRFRGGRSRLSRKKRRLRRRRESAWASTSAEKGWR